MYLLYGSMRSDLTVLYQLFLSVQRLSLRISCEQLRCGYLRLLSCAPEVDTGPGNSCTEFCQEQVCAIYHSL